jgi:streptomycin 6-kinase
MERSLRMPTDLVAAAEDQGRADWLATLPAAVTQLRRRWSISVGEPFEPGGTTAWVAPAHRDGTDLVLKVLWRHPEAEHEADALRTWAGRGAVRLYDACEVDAATGALLLERCRPGTTLRSRTEPEQDVGIADLLRRLWVRPPAGHPFGHLSAMCEMWADEFACKTDRTTGLDPGLVREGMTLFRELPGSTGREVLLCTDLHAGNVLAAEREPWLVIDAKPYVGDPTYDVLQHMLNCVRRLNDDPHGLVRRMAGLLDLDPQRLRLWCFARCVQESPERPQLAPVARALAPA